MFVNNRRNLSYLKIDINRSLRGEKISLFCTISQIALCLQSSSSTSRIWKRKSILESNGEDQAAVLSSFVPDFLTLPFLLLKSVLNPMVGRRKDSGRASRRSVIIF